MLVADRALKLPRARFRPVWRRLCVASAGRLVPVGEQEPVSGQIGQKASEMASQIELTARDLGRVGEEATALARALASKVASAVGSHPEDAEGSEISQQAREVAEALRRTTEDALRIAQRAVEMASKIAQAPSRGSSTSTD
jgi:hypothetical protein